MRRLPLIGTAGLDGVGGPTGMSNSCSQFEFM